MSDNESGNESPTEDTEMIGDGGGDDDDNNSNNNDKNNNNNNEEHDPESEGEEDEDPTLSAEAVSALKGFKLLVHQVEDDQLHNLMAFVYMMKGFIFADEETTSEEEIIDSLRNLIATRFESEDQKAISYGFVNLYESIEEKEERRWFLDFCFALLKKTVYTIIKRERRERPVRVKQEPTGDAPSVRIKEEPQPSMVVIKQEEPEPEPEPQPEPEPAGDEEPVPSPQSTEAINSEVEDAIGKFIEASRNNDFESIPFTPPVFKEHFEKVYEDEVGDVGETKAGEPPVEVSLEPGFPVDDGRTATKKGQGPHHKRGRRKVKRPNTPRKIPVVITYDGEFPLLRPAKYWGPKKKFALQEVIESGNANVPSTSATDFYPEGGPGQRRALALSNRAFQIANTNQEALSAIIEKDKENEDIRKKRKEASKFEAKTLEAEALIKEKDLTREEREAIAHQVEMARIEHYQNIRSDQGGSSFEQPSTKRNYNHLTVSNPIFTDKVPTYENFKNDAFDFMDLEGRIYRSSPVSGYMHVKVPIAKNRAHKAANGKELPLPQPGTVLFLFTKEACEEAHGPNKAKKKNKSPYGDMHSISDGVVLSGNVYRDTFSFRGYDSFRMSEKVTGLEPAEKKNDNSSRYSDISFSTQKPIKVRVLQLSGKKATGVIKYCSEF